MDLILWRHADAQEPVEGQADHDRALTRKGERQALRMGQWLNQHLPATTRVLVSPALRTQQTAQGLERKFKTAEALAPGATVDALLQTVRWPDAREPVLVVGHQTALGQTAAYLISGTSDPWAIRKGGFWWLRRRERNGEVSIVVQTVLTPDRV